MFKKLFSVILLGAALTAASSAGAATVSLIGSGQTYTVSNNDVLTDLNGTSIQMIDGLQKSASNGLFLDMAGAAAQITYTFMGSEAGNSNFSAVLGDAAFFNRGSYASLTGQTVTAMQYGSGLLDFAFGTYRPTWARGLFSNDDVARPASSSFAMGFVGISASAFYVLFDDIASGDRDFDDMVMRIDVAAVPLPAGGLLLLSALGCALLLRRRTIPV